MSRFSSLELELLLEEDESSSLEDAGDIMAVRVRGVGTIMASARGPWDVGLGRWAMADGDGNVAVPRAIP